MKVLHFVLSLFMFFTLVFTCKAQFNSTLYDKEAFLIGTLDDYMGYQRTFNAESDSFYYQKVDIYSKDELMTALFIDSLFNSKYTDIYLIDNGAPKGIKLYSPNLSKRIDKYFEYKTSASRTMQGDTVFYGLIKKDMFKTNKEKLSFLLGFFLRYRPDYNRIAMANSTSKAAVCADMLKEFGCADVEYTIKKGYIPVGHIITFEPSPEIQKIIEEADKLNYYISNINTNKIKFTLDGTKYRWKEPDYPKFHNKSNHSIDSIIVVGIGKDSLQKK